MWLMKHVTWHKQIYSIYVWFSKQNKIRRHICLASLFLHWPVSVDGKLIWIFQAATKRYTDILQQITGLENQGTLKKIMC